MGVAYNCYEGNLDECYNYKMPKDGNVFLR